MRQRLVEIQLREEAEAVQKILSLRPVRAPTMIEQSSREPDFKPVGLFNACKQFFYE